MSKVIRTIIAIAIILSGVVLFNYPTIASFANDFFASREVYDYEKQMEEIDRSELERLMNMAYAYNRSLPTAFPADPFTHSNIADIGSTDMASFEMIQPGASIGYIEIPSIGVYQPIYYGTDSSVLDKGLGLVENTSLPVGGPGTHAVISGHTGLATRKLFTDLDQMKTGDLFFVHVLDKHFAYKVDAINVVLPDETDKLAIEKDKELVTLLTCTPFGINDHRLLVRGSRIDYNFAVPEDDEKPAAYTPHGFTSYRQAGILALAVLFLILVLLKIRKDGRKDRRAAAEKAVGAAES